MPRAALTATRRSLAPWLASLVVLFGATPPSRAAAEDAETTDEPADRDAADDPGEGDTPPAAAPTPPLPSTAWPLDGRTACPSLRACCVAGEATCTHPGFSRLLLGGVGGGLAGVGVGMFLGVGDALDAGDPQGAIVGVGLIGLAGSVLGFLADLVTPGPAGAVRDRPGRPTLRISLSPGGSSTLDEQVPYGLGIRVDPFIALGPHVQLQPHVGASLNLGNRVVVDPRPQNVAPRAGQQGGFPRALAANRLRASLGAELAVKLPYPLAVRRPLYTGAVEIRWRPTWELRRRTLHPGASNVQLVELSTLYPATVGLRWHVAPRQRFTFYFGPRIDWLSFSDPGSTRLRRGGASLGTFYGEAWWQLDVPFSPRGLRKTTVTGRLNVGYIHSTLDGQRLDVGAIVGYFGPVEVSVDLRMRRQGAPVAVQVTGGVRIATGGGPFVELGVVAPEIGKAAR